jgi:hypothetical protein
LKNSQTSGVSGNFSEFEKFPAERDETIKESQDIFSEFEQFPGKQGIRKFFRI